MLAVITGASSGIGAEFARQLAARKYDLLLVARREHQLRGLAAELQSLHPVRAEILAADLTQASCREQLAGRLRDAKDLGLLVNNAGFGTNGYFFETNLQGQLDMHQLHVVATVHLSHAALENFVRRNSNHHAGIINVSSVAAFSAAPQNVSYCATKRWMNMFTEGLALELGGTGKNITVQALCPGYTRTEFQDKLSVDKSRIPASLWMPVDFVVRESLEGFDRKELYVVPGWRYKILVTVMKVLPAFLIRWGTIRAVRRYRRNKTQL